MKNYGKGNLNRFKMNLFIAKNERFLKPTITVKKQTSLSYPFVYNEDVIDDHNEKFPYIVFSQTIEKNGMDNYMKSFIHHML